MYTCIRLHVLYVVHNVVPHKDLYLQGKAPPFPLLPLFHPRIQMAKIIQQTHLSVWSNMSATPGIRHTILHQSFTSGGRPGLFAGHGMF